MEINGDRKPETARQYHVSIDCAIFHFDTDGLKVLLVNNEKENWGLPSHWISEGETIESTSNQILKKYIRVEVFYIKQLEAFNSSSQYSPSDNITIGYYVLVKKDNLYLENHLQSLEVQWWKIDEALHLNYKHRTILDYSLKELRRCICQSAIGFNLLPEKFTLLQAMQLYEEILGIEINKSNFRRKFFKMGLVSGLDEKQEDVSHRAAKFYKFNLENYKKLEQGRFNLRF
ncbi:NUDIX hydrolase [Flavobacterium sp. W22_SRS_FK3]|uniref:NUDIX hydrolase n=1 Tax=Flavobacterium sp. W22_SRS_FK3 TaxID=3240275 RepID=UPI003F903558